MAKIDQRIRLSPQQVDEVMQQTPHCRIATLGPGADINLTPMTFGWAGGCAYIFGRGQKIANLRKRSNCTILVDFGQKWRELVGVMMRGNALVLETAEQELADGGLSQARLNLAEKHGLDAPYGATASGRSRRWIVFTPRTVVSWDNSKL